MIVNEYPLLTFSIALSFGGALMIGLRVIRQKYYSIASMISLFIPGVMVLALILMYGFSETVIDKPFLSSRIIGSFSLVKDPISAPVALSISLVSGVISIYSNSYMLKRLGELNYRDVHGELGKYYVLYTIFSASMIGVALSTNLIEFYMFLEIGLIASFLLINYYGYGERSKIAIMYLVWTHIGAVSFFMGSLIYGLISGSFDYILASKGLLLGWGEGFSSNMMVKWAFYLMLFGLLVKTAIIGLHLWLPYAHAEAPTPISSLLSPLLIGLGPFAIIRFLIPLFPVMFKGIQVFVIILAIATIIYGGFTALYERDLKRFFAYSSISQMGYLLLGAASLSPVGIAGLVIHYVAHALSKAILFGSAGSIIYHTNGRRRLDELRGVASCLPITAGVTLLGFLGITGIPPALGFWSEILIIKALVDVSLSEFSHPIVFLLLGFLGFSLTLAYSFNMYRNVFFGKNQNMSKVSEDHKLLAPLVVMSIVLVLMFILAPQITVKTISFVGGWLQ